MDDCEKLVHVEVCMRGNTFVVGNGTSHSTNMLRIVLILSSACNKLMHQMCYGHSLNSKQQPHPPTKNKLMLCINYSLGGEEHPSYMFVYYSIKKLLGEPEPEPESCFNGLLLMVRSS